MYFKMSWGYNFPELEYKGTHEKTRVALGLRRNYNFIMYPLLGKGKCKIIPIQCACITCTNNIDTQWVPCNTYVDHQKYSCADNCLYASIPGSLNDCKIVTFDNSSTIEEAFNGINKVTLDRI